VYKETAEGGSNVISLSRKDTNYEEADLVAYVKQLKQDGYEFDQIICCIGTLHDDIAQPEKSLRQVNAEVLQHYFYVNSILPSIIIKVFSPLLNKSTSSRMACLSAMVGSTEDNQLGGWYGYRASKAALNSLIKTASIELKRSHKNSTLVAIHPGTTVGNLSKPFAKNIDPSKYYTPDQTAKRIQQVVADLKPEQTGSFLNWNGNVIPW